MNALIRAAESLLTWGVSAYAVRRRGVRRCLMSDLSIEIPFVRFNDTRTTSYSSIGRTAAESLPATPSECKNWRICNRKRGNGEHNDSSGQDQEPRGSGHRKG